MIAVAGVCRRGEAGGASRALGRWGTLRRAEPKSAVPAIAPHSGNVAATHSERPSAQMMSSRARRSTRRTSRCVVSGWSFMQGLIWRQYRFPRLPLAARRIMRGDSPPGVRRLDRSDEAMPAFTVAPPAFYHRCSVASRRSMCPSLRAEGLGAIRYCRAASRCSALELSRTARSLLAECAAAR